MLSLKTTYGFTMIDLVVSIFIIGLMSTIFFTNYHGTNGKNQLILSAQKLASDIRLAQNYSMGLKDFNGQASAGGWGAYFTTASSSYLIFSDMDGDHAYDNSESFKKVDLPSGVTLSSIDVGSPLSISFLPPDPVTYINQSTTSACMITLTGENNATKRIMVNSLGLVDVQ